MQGNGCGLVRTAGDKRQPISPVTLAWVAVKALLALLATTSLAAAGVSFATPIVVGPIPDQLIEGHTVFATIEAVTSATGGEHFAAAVVVLVQERVVESRSARFPGVLWFSDQYLVNPNHGDEGLELPDPFPEPELVRYPCSGAVLAMDASSASDFPLDANGTYFHGNASAYVESYFIRDVHDNDWITDKWRLPDGSLLWSVPIMNDQSRYAERDDGACEGSVAVDVPCEGMPNIPTYGCSPVGPKMSQYGLPLPTTHARSPGDNGWNYPCGNETAPCRPIMYNGLLYFRLDDLRSPGAPKDHTEDSSDWNSDVAGCDAANEAYPCPDGDDDREGNSHPFNPERPWPAEELAGRGNHGGSDDCDGDGLAEQPCHATRRIRIVYGVAAVPLVREYWLVDLEGSDAPYHCHDENFCGPEDAWTFPP